MYIFVGKNQEDDIDMRMHTCIVASRSTCVPVGLGVCAYTHSPYMWTKLHTSTTHQQTNTQQKQAQHASVLYGLGFAMAWGLRWPVEGVAICSNGSWLGGSKPIEPKVSWSLRDLPQDLEELKTWLLAGALPSLLCRPSVACRVWEWFLFNMPESYVVHCRLMLGNAMPQLLRNGGHGESDSCALGLGLSSDTSLAVFPAEVPLLVACAHVVRPPKAGTRTWWSPSWLPFPAPHGEALEVLGRWRSYKLITA